MQELDAMHAAPTITRYSEHVAPDVPTRLRRSLRDVAELIMPVWPLKDYVAVNPFFGLRDKDFLDSRALLRSFSDIETLPPLSDFAERFKRGEFNLWHIREALDPRDGGLDENNRPWGVTAEQIERALRDLHTSNLSRSSGSKRARIRTIAEYATSERTIDWAEVVRDEISKYCAIHYDDGEATWRSPWRHRSLYDAWRLAAVHDLNVEAIGIQGFRRFVASLPLDPHEAILYLLDRLEVPEDSWRSFLACEAFSVQGWAAYTRYSDEQRQEDAADDFLGLMAIRIAYDAALATALQLDVAWRSGLDRMFHRPNDDGAHDPLLSRIQLTLLRATEIAYRERLVLQLRPDREPTTKRPLAQMVFCIDVRSERVRRSIETANPSIETRGFAGFMGLPIAYRPMSEPDHLPHVPALLRPNLSIDEGLCGTVDPVESEQVNASRFRIRTWRKLWQLFQVSAVTCFSFVETTGLWAALRLAGRSWRVHGGAPRAQLDGLMPHQARRLGPILSEKSSCPRFHEQSVAAVAGALRNMGLVQGFSRVVVFCGHTSRTENNPLSASLECGACGGHSGEPNSKLLAELLNHPLVRRDLKTHGIEIPEDTFFLSAVHITTTDRIELLNLHQLPVTHQDDAKQLISAIEQGCRNARTYDRYHEHHGHTGQLDHKAADWSEVRPEWGLAGNAAMIVAPRAWTRNANLEGRVFLHEYDAELDPDSTILETILTKPVVVANWINMQYYASAVDPQHFGSGEKPVHNVVGKFGLLSGNGGDLKTGLPWQSVHDGQQLAHPPLRLQVFVAASREAIDRVLEAHEVIRSLATNGWLHLVSIEADRMYQLQSYGEWCEVVYTS